MKSGFTAIIGRPSAGKSTLLNTLCGEKVAITSPVPQTTRNAIRGIVNREQGQIVFVDTPGYHKSEKKLNTYLKDSVHRSLDDADTVLYVVDATRVPGPEELEIMKLLRKSGKPVIAALNKTDLETPYLPEIRGHIQALLMPAALLNISAVKNRGLDTLLEKIFELMPEGQALYSKEFYTDQNPEFRIAEIIREKAIQGTRDEVPHSVYVEIADMEFRSENHLWVRAFLMVERPSQTGILVGHKGENIKKIRVSSIIEMKRIFPWKISLDLRVKVHPKWRRKDTLLKNMLGPEQ
ncbi:MAG: GTPase Era [Spirochaetales bacterium]|nr:MAG: GTPase Era [Spirochaetales bacterium]